MNKRKIAAAIVVLGSLISAAAAGAGEVFQRVYGQKIIDAAVINGTAEVCSNPLSTTRVQFLSVQWRAASGTGTADVRLYLTASIDENNFAVPGGVSDIASSDTTEAWRIEGIYVPLVRQIKVCVKGNATNPADTLATVWLALQ
jgi:hypothetical protein